MNDLITICIPTYERLECLQEALASVKAQDYRPLEILIGDDSVSERTKEWADTLAPDPGLTIRYWRNTPGKGQNANVNDLFSKTSGNWLVLLHDDDTLLPGAIETMAACRAYRPELRIVFGKCETMSQDGKVLRADTSRINRFYARVPERAGALPSTLEAALLQMIPNDGYLVRSDVAREIGYRAEAGPLCDLDFTLRFALKYEHWAAHFVDAHTSRYRYSRKAISRDRALAQIEQPRSGLMLYRFVAGLQLDPKLAPAQRTLLRRLSFKALKGLALVEGDRDGARRLYFSGNYPWRQRLTPTGLYQLRLIALPESLIFRTGPPQSRP